jgi:hypothetical protein
MRMFELDINDIPDVTWIVLGCLAGVLLVVVAIALHVFWD